LIESVAINVPKPLRLFRKVLRIDYFPVVNGFILFDPLNESLVSTEIRKAAVHTHTRSAVDDKGISLGYERGGSIDEFLICHFNN
jgi:hypothetical protein